MSEMVGRIAKAMQAESGGKPFSWENAARAAIETLGEPTEEMLAACEAEWRAHIVDKVKAGAFGEGSVRAPFLANWKAMINAALK